MMAVRISRRRLTNWAQNPKSQRWAGRRLGARRRERCRTRSCCFKRIFSARTARVPPVPRRTASLASRCTITKIAFFMDKKLAQHRTQEQGSRIAAATHLNYEFAMYRQKVAVHRLDLMRQYVHHTGIDREQRVELVGDADALSLSAEQKDLWVAVEGMALVTDFDELRQFLGAERPTNLPPGLKRDALHQRLGAKRCQPPDLDQFVGFQTRNNIARRNHHHVLRSRFRPSGGAA